MTAPLWIELAASTQKIRANGCMTLLRNALHLGDVILIHTQLGMAQMTIIRLLASQKIHILLHLPHQIHQAFMDTPITPTIASRSTISIKVLALTLIATAKCKACTLPSLDQMMILAVIAPSLEIGTI